MQHASIALMAHYRITSKYAYTLEPDQVKQDFLSVVDPDFTPEMMDIAKANLRCNYDVIDRNSAYQTVQMLLEHAEADDTFADEDGHFLRQHQDLLRLAGAAGTAGFQYSRSVEIISRSVFCGYLSEEEANNLLNGIGDEVKNLFANWQQFWASSMLGKLLMTCRFNPQSDMILAVEDYVKDVLLLLLSPSRPLQYLNILPLGDTAPLQTALQGLLQEPFDMQAFKDTDSVSAETAYEVLVWPALQKYDIANLLVGSPLTRMCFASDGEFYFHNFVNDTKLFMKNYEQFPDEMPLIVFDKGMMSTRGVYYHKSKMVFWGDDYFTAWEDGARLTVKTPWEGGSLEIYINDIKIGYCQLRKQNFANEQAEKKFLDAARKKLEDFLNSFAHATIQWR